jgi:hypothetical protein
MQHGSELPQLSDEFAFKHAPSRIVLDFLERAYLTDIPHAGVNAFDMELVLETHGQPMKRTERAAMLLEIRIELLRLFYCRVKENLMQTIDLQKAVSETTYRSGE